MLKENINSDIQPICRESMNRAKQRWDSVAKPLESLGILEENIIKIAGIMRTPDICIDKKAVVIMCSDNGVVEEGVTQAPKEVTAVVTENFAKGATSVNCMANIAGAKTFPIDVGVYRDLSEQGVINKKIAYGTKNFTKEPAMTREEAERAIEIGINTVKELAKEGYNLIATGEMGIGNTTTSSAVTAVLLGVEVEAVTGRGAGLSSEGLVKKIDAIKRGIALHCPNPSDGIDVVSKIGGFDLAALAGVFIGGAIYKVPVLVDGIISSSAALLAEAINPLSAEYMIASHISKEPSGEAIINKLKLKPFLNAQMCLGEGTGAVAIMPILDMALSVYKNMSTFSEIEIEEYKPLD